MCELRPTRYAKNGCVDPCKMPGRDLGTFRSSSGRDVGRRRCVGDSRDGFRRIAASFRERGRSYARRIRSWSAGRDIDAVAALNSLLEGNESKRPLSGHEVNDGQYDTSMRRGSSVSAGYGPPGTAQVVGARSDSCEVRAVPAVGGVAAPTKVAATSTSKASNVPQVLLRAGAPPGPTWAAAGTPRKSARSSKSDPTPRSRRRAGRPKLTSVDHYPRSGRIRRERHCGVARRGVRRCECSEIARSRPVARPATERARRCGVAKSSTATTTVIEARDPQRRQHQPRTRWVPRPVVRDARRSRVRSPL